MNSVPLYDFTPLLRLGLMALLIALAPLAWIWLRHRGASAPQRQRALTLLTLFLTFDLVLFGAFTRLTDSGLGCPDWPGCYGNASPVGARAQIDAAQSALPSGPVTLGKAWVEMVHRYLAAAVGVLILVSTASSWFSARRRVGAISPWWPTLTLVWVCIQGAFGALTVTMKLYPAIVTLHLLGGMVLLALLAAQTQAEGEPTLSLPPGIKRATIGVAALTTLQIALGGWVSTNYAVMACTDFPLCQGQWWPPMSFAEGFQVRRELGVSAQGGFLPFEALTAIHYVHRLMAYVLLLALCAHAWGLWSGADAELKRWGAAVAGLALWQLASGLSNVLLNWPLLGAVAHTGGAAALVTLLALMLARARPSHRAAQVIAPAASGVRATS
jgi:heme a synthase